MLPPLLFFVLAACSGQKVADADADGWDVRVDCDDGNADVHPNADETCDGVDHDCDCDGSVDEGAVDAPTWYPDSDGDDWGADAGSVVVCEAPAGSVAATGDCDDGDPAFHPGAEESDCADPSDYNCDGSVDHADADGDGSAACADCDDRDAAVNPSAEVCNGAASGVNPGATETCDGRDDDCDGAVDDADESLDVATAGAYYADADGDGYGTGDMIRACFQPAETARLDGDCDDAAARVCPGTAETCDGVDDDCDGLVDDADPDVGAPTWHLEHDGDGYGGGGFSWASCDAPPATRARVGRRRRTGGRWRPREGGGSGASKRS